jgi:hypothetical protein
MGEAGLVLRESRQRRLPGIFADLSVRFGQRNHIAASAMLQAGMPALPAKYSLPSKDAPRA